MGSPGSTDLRTTTGAVALARDVVLVHGPDAVAYLQGQLSQDVEGMAVGESAPSLLLQPTGKVDAWLRVTRTAEDAVLLDVDAGFGEALLARLRRFLLRTKATLEPATWTGLAIRGPDAASLAPAEGQHLTAGWPGVDGVDVLAPEGVATAATASADSLEALRIEAGVPAMGAEVTDATIPAELGQWLIDASVSFTKGCYTGQELVARIDSRGGKVPHPVRRLRVEGAAPAAGAPVLLDGAEVGHVTSSAESGGGAVALAVVARSVEPGRTVAVGAEPSVPATVEELAVP